LIIIHSQNVLIGGLPVISSEKCQRRFVIQCFSCIPKKLFQIIKNYQLFSNIIIFIDLLLPVSWNTSDYYTDYQRFSCFFKAHNLFHSNWNFIRYFFIYTMKLAPISNMFLLSMSVWIEATCHNCQILSKLKFCENY